MKEKLIGNDEERAVSPVIGVILMVAITVILAAVIAAFVLDMGDLDESAPNAQFEWSTGEGDNSAATNITLTHESGDNIDASNLRVSVDAGSESDDTTLSGEFTGGDTIELGPVDGGSDKFLISGDIDSDAELTDINMADAADASSEIDQITVTWEGDSSSTVIAEYEP